MDLLADFLSRDAHRIWSASGAVRQLREPHELARLVAAIDRIDAATRGIALGGLVGPNSRHLEFALRKLRFVRDVGGACLCALYAQDDLFDPEREAREGHVAIVSRDVPAYRLACRCTGCAAAWDVEEREYHFPWWIWTRRGDGQGDRPGAQVSAGGC